MFGGIVIHGDGEGKKLGYPTANLDIPIKNTKLKEGVYAAYVLLQNKKYQGALIIMNHTNKVEVHLLEYSGPDFYTAYLQIDPVQKISEIESIESQEELRQKIKHDVEIVKNVFEEEDF